MLKILRGLFLITTICYTQGILAQQNDIRAFAFLDSNIMLIGDRATLHIGIEHGDKDNIESITPQMPLDSTFEIIKMGKWEDGKRRSADRYIVFTVWDTGLYRIPSVEFLIRLSNGEQRLYKSPPLLLTVNNPKGVDFMAAPAGIKEIIQEDRTLEDIMPYLIALTLLLGLGFAVWFFYKKWKEKPLAPLVQKTIHPPYVTAERLLKELKIKQLWQQGRVKEYYSELSYILRGYLEEAYKIPALESTTDELMTLLKNKKETVFQGIQKPDVLLEKMQNLLETADLAKFAKVIPADTVHDTYWADAFEVVDKTKPKPVEVSENQPVTSP